MCYHHRRKHYDSCQSHFTRKFFPNANETHPLTIYLLQNSAVRAHHTLYFYIRYYYVLYYAAYAFTVASPDINHIHNERGDKQATAPSCWSFLVLFSYVCALLFCLYFFFGIGCTQSRTQIANKKIETKTVSGIVCTLEATGDHYIIIASNG